VGVKVEGVRLRAGLERRRLGFVSGFVLGFVSAFVSGLLLGVLAGVLLSRLVLDARARSVLK